MSLSEFRAEVKQFISDSLSPDLARAGELMTSVFADFDASLKWQKILNKRGWAAADWPQEYGGTGWDIERRAIFQEECKLANAPALMPMGIQMLGPMLIRYGSDQQKNQLLPKILSGEDVWCQGYSEPGAGSDLAALKTSAQSDGDDYLINGSKIWTSFAQYSNKIFCLVKTASEGRPQASISFILVDLNSPGIRIDPIVSLDGHVEQCQVFFDDVRVPKTNLVGKENQGWEVAKYLLEHERGGHNFTIDIKKQQKKIRRQAALEVDHDGVLWRDSAGLRSRYAALVADAMALECAELKIKGALKGGEPTGALASVTKVVGTELGQKFNELSIEILGQQAHPFQIEALAPGFDGVALLPEHALTAMPEYLNNRASTIYGGSAEIQREIIAKQILGI